MREACMLVLAEVVGRNEPSEFRQDLVACGCTAGDEKQLLPWLTSQIGEDFSYSTGIPLSTSLDRISSRLPSAAPVCNISLHTALNYRPGAAFGALEILHAPYFSKGPRSCPSLVRTIDSTWNASKTVR